VGGTGSGRLLNVEDVEELAALGAALKDLLLASYGLYPSDLARVVAEASRHLGGDEVVLLLADYDQHSLVGFDSDDDREFPVEGPGPGLAFRHESVVQEDLGGARRRLWVPVKDSAERLGVLGVVDDGSVRVEQWETVASLVGELIVSKAQYGDHITLRRRRRGFSLAAEMRWALLPPLTFTSPDVSISGCVQPSHGIAGDAFDYAVTGRIASLGIFDAMGHGIESSRMANVAVGSYRNARRAGADVVVALRAVDDAMASQFGECRFVTAQLATFDLDSGEMEIVNAGHPLPLRLAAGQQAQIITCPPTAPAGLGSDPTPTRITLDREDAVVFRTDGVGEARSPRGHFFDDDQLASLIGELHEAGLTPAEVLRRCLHAVVRHQDSRPSDDATLLLLRWANETDLSSARLERQRSAQSSAALGDLAPPAGANS
jgi:serine phosphatase RsbU (regulator of sigma subunit)